MHVVAEMLAALVVGLAAATFSWFGLALESREPVAERTVKRVSTATPSHMIVTPQTDPASPIPC